MQYNAVTSDYFNSSVHIRDNSVQNSGKSGGIDIVHIKCDFDEEKGFRFQVIGDDKKRINLDELDLAQKAKVTAYSTITIQNIVNSVIAANMGDVNTEFAAFTVLLSSINIILRELHEIAEERIKRIKESKAAQNGRYTDITVDVEALKEALKKKIEEKEEQGRENNDK